MVQIHNAFTLFLSLLVEAIPFLLIGVLLSSSLLFFMDEGLLIAKLPKNPFLGSLVGSCIGFLFPVCECGNVPVARRLLLKGVSPSIAISFLLAAPTINPVVIWSTWIAFGEQPSIVWLRVLFSLIIAIFIGFVFSKQKDAQPLLQPTLVKRLTRWQSNYNQNLVDSQQEKEKISPLLQSGTFLLNQGQILSMDASLAEVKQDYLPLQSKLSKFYRFSDNVVQELRELGGMLILGSAIAASIQVFVPREFVISLGQDAITSILAMMLLSAIVSICSTVDSFFVLSFAATFTSSSLLAFLIFGPMIDIKGIGLMLTVFKPRIIIYIFALAAQLAFILTFTYGYLF
ncbi:MAG: permease [Xenococcaceae cyanobacterium]